MSKYLIRLSDADCNEICEGSTQSESSKHLLVTAGGNMYKVLYCSDELESYILYSKKKRSTSKSLLFLDVVIKCVNIHLCTIFSIKSIASCAY